MSDDKRSRITRRQALQTTAWLAVAASTTGAVLTRKSWAGVIPTVTDPRFTTPVIDPAGIPKFQDALPVPGAAWPQFNAGSQAMRVVQTQAQVLPQTWNLKTPAYCYRGSADYSNTFLGPTTIAYSRYPNTVSYDYAAIGPTMVLKNGAGTTSVVDQHIHGTDLGQPQVRFITHLHGSIGVASNSDGYADAWVTPTGTKGATPAGTMPTTVGAKQTHTYPNIQRASMTWYHNHTVGLTRLNVYAGLAGAYLVTDPTEQGYISKKQLPDLGIPLVIMDRMFFPDGRFAYPDTPWTEGTCQAQWPANAVSTQPEFFGDVIVVNGKTWPVFDCEPKVYRFRLLNACNSRFLQLAFKEFTIPFTIIGTDAGMLPGPSVTQNSLLVAPAERFDILIDFRTYAGKTVTLKNSANIPYPGGDPINPNTDGLVMQFRVKSGPVGPALAAPPSKWNPTNPTPAGPIVRRVLLCEGQDVYGRVMPMLGVANPNGSGKLTGVAKMWDDPVTETPKVGSCETWEVYNVSEDAHPFHIHEAMLRVLNRQDVVYDEPEQTCGDMPIINNIALSGATQPPAPYEVGYKDVAICPPGQVTRLIMDFTAAKTGRFVWHCHILEHEDHDMMRAYDIVA
jgi:spore coat protein A, manganese oxidase